MGNKGHSSEIPQWELEKNALPEGLKDALEGRVMDIDPVSLGSGEALKKIGDASVGVTDASIGRCDPELQVVKIALRGGQSVVVIGPNGAGKSTIFDALTEKSGAVFHLRERGGFRYGSSTHGREKLRIARLEQEELFPSTKALTAREALEHTASYYKSQLEVDWDALADIHDPEEMSARIECNQVHEAAQTRIDELMAKFIRFFEMEEFLDREVKDLSGGERTKVALFMMLLSEPDLLLLDEPTNHLDLDSISKLVGLFEKYKKAGTAIVSISHVQWFLRDAGHDGVVSITYDGAHRKTKQTSSSYENYTKDSSLPDLHIMRGKIEWPFGAYEYDKISGRRIVSPLSDAIIIPNSPLRDIRAPSLHVGDMVVVSGKNGSGKSKLLEAIARSVAEGEESGFTRDRTLNIAYLPQFWPDRVAEGTLEEFFVWVRDGINPHFVTPSSEFLRKLRDVNFGARRGYVKTQDLLRERISRFSGGEQRVLWFLAVSSIKSVEAAERGSQYVKASKLPTVSALLLDEPTNHMDQNLQKVVIAAIQDFRGAVMLATHDVDLMEKLSRSAGRKTGMASKAKHLMVLKESGRSEIFESSETPAAYAKRVREDALKKARRLRV